MARLSRRRLMAGGALLGFGVGLAACGAEETFCDLRFEFQHNDQAMDVAFSRDGKLLATTSQDRTIKIIDPKTGELVRLIEGVVDEGTEVAFRADENVLAAADTSGVKLVDAGTGEVVLVTEMGRDIIWSVEFSPDGRLLVVGSLLNPEITVLDGNSGAEITQLIGHEEGGQSVAFSPDGRLLASTGGEGTVRIWDAESLAEVKVLPVAVGTRGVAFSPDGKLLAAGTLQAGAVGVWHTDGWGGAYWMEVDTGVELRGGNDLVGVNDLDFSSDGEFLATAGYDGRIRLWDPSTGADLGLAHIYDDPAFSVRFSPDGKILASASHNGEVVVTGVCPWDRVGPPGSRGPVS